METFSALLALCVRNSLVTGEFPTQRPVTQSFNVIWSTHELTVQVNNREAGDLRRHRAHYDIIVMLNVLISRQASLCDFTNTAYYTKYDTI